MAIDIKSRESKIGNQPSEVWVLPAALRQLEESGEGPLVDELIAMFEEDTVERLAVLSRALETADYLTARQESHTIKGSSLQVGAVRVAEVCLQMEVELRKPQPEGLVPLFQALLLSFEEFRGLMAARRGPAADGS
jgi:histidine phosphotransfer protein HptB